MMDQVDRREEYKITTILSGSALLYMHLEMQRKVKALNRRLW